MKYLFKIQIITLLLILSSCGSDDGANLTLEFKTLPEESADHNRLYDYRFNVESTETETVTYTVNHPNWLEYNEVIGRLYGTPGWENLGNHSVEIIASDGNSEVTQSFTISVTRGEIICNQSFGDPSESPYVLPFKVGESARITQSYCRAQTGGHHLTFAYDFAMDIGDTIRASRGGLVYRVQESYEDGNGVPGQENFIYLEHDDGTVFRYVHLTKNGALVDAGTRVAKGQPIGLNGLTGATSSPHLHLELFRNRDFNSTSDKSRKFSLPVNFSNAEGRFDSNNGLILNEVYTALQY